MAYLNQRGITQHLNRRRPLMSERLLDRRLEFRLLGDPNPQSAAGADVIGDIRVTSTSLQKT